MMTDTENDVLLCGCPVACVNTSTFTRAMNAKQRLYSVHSTTVMNYHKMMYSSYDSIFLEGHLNFFFCSLYFEEKEVLIFEQDSCKESGDPHPQK